LSITSSWGNGHATTYRALTKALARRGHKIVFLEREVEWYRTNRDLPQSSYADIRLYESASEAFSRFGALVGAADVAILGSFVEDGAMLADWLTRESKGVAAFYDIDTPVTLAALAKGSCAYLARRNVPDFDLYLSFTGGPTLKRIEREFGAQRALPLYCAVDPEIHAPAAAGKRWDLGYLGTFSPDRQPKVRELLLASALRMPGRAFVIGGPQYPDVAHWPDNVAHVAHVPPPDHAAFYSAQRFTLNVTRADMIAAGWSPSVRLFEAAACGTPIISDDWPGLTSLFAPRSEIVIAQDSADVCKVLESVTEKERLRLAGAARRRVLREHTADHRARELEGYVSDCLAARQRRSRASREGYAMPDARLRSA
jgi:spore maturation protein CgeB